MTDKELYKEEIRFIKALKEDYDQDQNGGLVKQVKDLKKNDWEGLKAVANKAEFEVTVKGLKTALPTNFYETMGWDIPDEKKLKK